LGGAELQAASEGAKAVDRWKSASVNLALAALDSFYTQLGLGRPIVRREGLPARAPRAIVKSSSGDCCG